MKLPIQPIIQLFIIGTIAFLFWIVGPVVGVNTTSLTSPLNPSSTLTTNSEAISLNVWFPNVQVQSSYDLDVSAQSAVSYDLTTEKMLFAKNISARLPMASITKIMTAIISLEHPALHDKYVVRKSTLVGEDSMGLSAGEILSLKELLYGLLLHSGNDAAEVLADNFPGGRDAFIHAMNQKVVALGLSNTHFTNPTGLEGDGNQYTTVSDLVVITKYALESFLDFADVAQTPQYTISQTDTHKEYDLENETNLLTSYPGVKGVKTGYTPEANLCLVTYLDYQGHSIIAVVLGSENRRDDMKEILDFSLQKLGITPPTHG